MRLSLKKVLRIIGTLLSGVALIYFAVRIFAQLDAMGGLNLTPKSFLILGAPVILVPVQFFLAAIAWQRILQWLGLQLPVHEALRITFLSQLVRYIPGNVGHHLGKVILAKRKGLPVKVVVLSIFVETGLTLVCALAISLAALPELFFTILVWAEDHRFGIGFIAVVFLACLMLVALGWKHDFMSYLKPQLKDYYKRGWGCFCGAFFCYTLNILFLGGLAWWIGFLVVEIQDLSFILCVGVMALAWTAGFLTPGAPAGLGVREILAISFLGPVMGEADALFLVALHRVVLSLGDLLTFLLGVLLNRHSRLEPESI